MMRGLVLLAVLGGCDVVWSVDHVGKFVPLPDAYDPGIAGLVAWYPLDGVVNGTARDLANGHDAICVGERCPVDDVGKIGQAQRFDGTDDILQIASDPPLMTTAGFTVSAWVQLATATNACAVSKQVDNASFHNTYQFCVEVYNGSVITYFNSWDGTKAHEMAGPEISVGVWHHIAMRWDGTMKSLVIDGVAMAPSAVLIAFDASTITIGAGVDDGLVAKWSGPIDDVRIYDHALAMPEIAKLALP